MRKLIAVLATFGFVAVWYYALLMPRNETPDSPMVGKIAPAFELQKIGGGKMSLAGLRGRPVLVNFWASWCTVCKIEAKVLQAANLKYSDAGLAVVGIAIQDRAEDAAAFALAHGKTYSILLDPEGAIAVDYGVFGVPESYFVDKDGVIQAKIVGEVTEMELVSALAKVGIVAGGKS